MKKSIETAKHVPPSLVTKASTHETPARKKKGRRPGDELWVLIEIVNLMSPKDIGANPRAMSEEEFMAWLETLSPGFRGHLLAYLDDMQKNSVWANDSAWPTKLLIPFVAEHYQELTVAREGFYRLLSHKIHRAHGSPFVQSYIPTACNLVVNEGRVEIELSLFGRAIQGAELDYIRQCPVETCLRIFYAERKNQLCCAVRCAKKLRQQKWRSKYGKPVLTKQEEMKLNKKKKRANTARER